LYDTFEPNYIRAALTEKPLNLGTLIFGAEAWAAFHKVLGSTTVTNPLEEMFRKRGNICLEEIRRIMRVS